MPSAPVSAQAPGDWSEQAACAGKDHDLFFPPFDLGPKLGPPGQPPDPRWNEARAICAECPVQIECLDFAMRTRQEYGLWGGLTPIERRHLRRGR